jgi:hypothetical protein
MAENRYSEVLSATSSLLIDQFANMGIEDDVDDEGARMVTNSILCNLFWVFFKLFEWLRNMFLFSFYIFVQGGWDLFFSLMKYY